MVYSLIRGKYIPQVKKADIKKQIDQASLVLFSQKGFKNTTVYDIALKAGLSVGNIYRYYPRKELILREIIPSDLLENLLELVRNKIQVWKDTGGKGQLNILNSEQLVEFLFSNRYQILILFKQNNIPDQLADEISSILKAVYRNKDNAGDIEFRMSQVFFKKMIEMMEEALSFYQYEDDLKQAFRLVHSYHMFGITGIFNKYGDLSPGV